MKFIFTKVVQKKLKKLDKLVYEQILKKIILLKNDQLFDQNIITVDGLEPATHRIRVGNYRLLIVLDASSNVCLVLKVAHRRDVYN